MAKRQMDLTFGNGKYRITQVVGETAYAYRHGKLWVAKTKDLIGNNCDLTLAWELFEARQQIEELKTHKERLPFVTGSYAYGIPNKESDIDVVVYIKTEEFNILQKRADKSSKIDEAKLELYQQAHTDPLWFGKLNLICCHDKVIYDCWKAGTRKLIKQAPVSREFACKYFERFREKWMKDHE